ncbi:hypothetical protein HD806DRAFT_505134 [Xylariaceae sp. AK1471]|nr:hypothetical protein HD806DRAFT_505134 [Xylariaceae sp. AK1471]
MSPQLNERKNMQSPAARLESQGAAAHDPIQYAKPSEWAAQKDIIRKLYLVENKTLDEVRRIMADEHQFHATPSMYKKRIRSWRFSKKLQEDDVLDVLQQKLEKQAAGENSPAFVIRGRLVKNQRIKRFLERRPETLARLQVNSTSVSTIGSSRSPSEVSTEIPRVRSLSPESRNLERTLTVVRNYIRKCAFGPDASWIWTPAGYASQMGRITDQRTSRSDMFLAVDEFYLLQASIDNNEPPKEVFHLLNSTLNRLSGVIRTELPDFFFHMIEILQHRWSSYPDLSQIFRRHVAELAVAHLGRNHPISILWLHLLRGQDGESLGVPHTVLDMLLQELAVSLGSQDHLTCVALDYLLRFVTYTQGPAMAAKRFKDWMSAYPGWDDPARWSEIVKSRLAISQCRLVRSNYHAIDTRPFTSAAMRYQKPGIDPLSELHSNFMLSYLGGRIAIRNGDSERAEGWFLKALTVAKQCRGPKKTDYLVKVFTNLQVLYTATYKEEKLATILEELKALKAEWPTEEEVP